MKLKRVLQQRINISDTDTFDKLPLELQAFFKEYNGLIAFEGGFIIRACVKEPAWLSVQAAYTGGQALARQYTYVQESDIPFALDCFGDQYLWRKGAIVKLNAEYGEVEELAESLAAFMAEVENDPVEYLALESFRSYLAKGNTFTPGQLINVYPPFTMNSANERVLKAVPAEEQMAFLLNFYQQIKPLAEGGK
jgi:hypothetical protein